MEDLRWSNLSCSDWSDSNWKMFNKNVVIIDKSYQTIKNSCRDGEEPFERILTSSFTFYLQEASAEDDPEFDEEMAPEEEIAPEEVCQWWPPRTIFFNSIFLGRKQKGILL